VSVESLPPAAATKRTRHGRRHAPRSPARRFGTRSRPPSPHRWPPAVRALRPLQWTKNGVLFAALVFDQRLFELDPLLRTLVAALVFCGLSSAVYLINDVRDIEADRQHPVKRFRAITSGELKPRTALTMTVVLLTVSLGVAYLVRPEFLLVSLAYVGLMIAYTFWLKQVVLIDVLTIAAGFVLRAAAGAIAIAVEISPWLLVCTMLLALLLAFGKRRHEVLILRSRAARHRASLETYSPRLLDQLIGITAASTVIAYAVYTFDSASVPANHTMMFTIPLVVYAIFRYLYLVYLRRMGGSPEVMLVRDRPLLVSIVLWGAGSVLVLYLWA
jgi:4-hydroxybenzoate polyprenyltransferase